MLRFDDCPTSAYENVTYACATPVVAQLPNGKNLTLRVGARTKENGRTSLKHYERHTFAVPVQGADVRVLGRAAARGSDEGCVLSNVTNGTHVTCRCTHLTSFASRAEETAATAQTLVNLAGSLSLADILGVLGIIITILVFYGLFLGCWWYGRYLDDLDHTTKVREELKIFTEVSAAPEKRASAVKAAKGIALMTNSSPPRTARATRSPTFCTRSSRRSRGPSCGRSRRGRASRPSTRS